MEGLRNLSDTVVAHATFVNSQLEDGWTKLEVVTNENVTDTIQHLNINPGQASSSNEETSDRKVAKVLIITDETQGASLAPLFNAMLFIMLMRQTQP